MMKTLLILGLAIFCLKQPLLSLNLSFLILTNIVDKCLPRVLHRKPSQISASEGSTVLHRAEHLHLKKGSNIFRKGKEKNMWVLNSLVVEWPFSILTIPMIRENMHKAYFLGIRLLPTCYISLTCVCDSMTKGMDSCWNSKRILMHPFHEKWIKHCHTCNT